MSIIFMSVGLERRLLATVRWTVADNLAFPQKSESNKVKGNSEKWIGDYVRFTDEKKNLKK